MLQLLSSDLLPEESLPCQGLGWSITFKAGHFQLEQLFIAGMGMYHQGKLGFQLFVSEPQMHQLVLKQACYISLCSFLVQLQRKWNKPGQCHQTSLLPILYPTQDALLHVLPWDTSEFSVSRTVCCHVPETNTNSFNTEYSLSVGSDNLISSLWNLKKIPVVSLCQSTKQLHSNYPKFWCFETLSKQKFEEFLFTSQP